MSLSVYSDKLNARLEADAQLRRIAIAQAGLTAEYERADRDEEYGACERLAAQVGRPFDAPLPGRDPLFSTVDLSDIENATTGAIDYAVFPLLPRGHVTLLGGHGGAGKSILALTLAAHVAAGRSWAALATEKLSSVFVSLEDRGDLVRHRLRNVIDSYGLSSSEVTSRLSILDGTDCPILACEIVNYGDRSLVKTPALLELSDAVRGAGLVIIDNASDAFDGQENDRRQVRAFVRMLGEIARANNAAICLLAHIDKSAARYGSAGNSYSGSTAWHNSARSRLALLSDDGSIELRQEKLNLAKANSPIQLAWNEHGVLKPSDPWSKAETDELAVLAALREAITSGATVNTTTASAYSAAKCLEPFLPMEFMTSKGSRRVNRALVLLQATGQIRRERYRSEQRKTRERWVLAQDSAL
ncbi:MAG: AAA family ATPase [Rhizobium sp.]|nr:AAA family ATPase [Rhizobium sp.]